MRGDLHSEAAQAPPIQKWDKTDTTEMREGWHERTVGEILGP